MCRALRVSSSGFCDWLSRLLSNHAIEDRRLLLLSRVSYTASGGAYGGGRVFQDQASGRAHHENQRYQGCAWQLYLAVAMDLLGRKVVGWSKKPTLARELVLDAIRMAVWRRKPKRRVLIFASPRSRLHKAVQIDLEIERILQQ